MEKRKDPYSGEFFIPIRKNQKFVNRQNQIDFNNNKARLKRLAKAKIDKILNHNRNVLFRILGDENEIIIEIEELTKMNYKFGYHTHYILTNQETKTYATFVYDIGYVKLSNDKIKIFKYE